MAQSPGLSRKVILTSAALLIALAAIALITLPHAARPAPRPTSAASVRPTIAQPPTVTPSPTPPYAQQAMDFPTQAVPYDPLDPALPALIFPADRGYRLDPAWQVRSIEYKTTWSTIMGLFSEDRHTVTRQGDAFSGDDDQSLSQADVQTLLNAVVRLHPNMMAITADPSPQNDVSTVMSRMYIDTTIRLTGMDGAQVLLSHTSIKYQPGVWNVTYNGRIYAQFDETLMPVVARLFPPSVACGDNPCRLPDEPLPPLLAVSNAQKLPDEITYGFSGLDETRTFSYVTNPVTGTLDGLIYPDRSMYSTVRGVTITADNWPDPITCEVTQNLVRYNMYDWTKTETGFTCPIPNMQPGDRYHFAIRVSHETENHQPTVDTGDLFGIWGGMPIPDLSATGEEVAILNRFAQARDLLADHVVSSLHYTADIDTATGEIVNASGAVLLDGQAALAGVSIPTRIDTIFTLRNGQPLAWDLDREALNRTLDDLAALPITRRIVKNVPGVSLVLVQRAEGSTQEKDTVRLKSCGPIPEETYPSAAKPLRQVEFRLDIRDTWSFLILMLDGPTATVGRVTIEAPQDMAFARAVLPPEMRLSPDTPFRTVWFRRLRYVDLDNTPPDINIFLKSEPSPQDQAAAANLAAALSAKIRETSDPDHWLMLDHETYYEWRNIRADLTADGRISFTSCDPVR